MIQNFSKAFGVVDKIQEKLNFISECFDLPKICCSAKVKEVTIGKTKQIKLSLRIPDAQILSVGLPEKIVGYPENVEHRILTVLDKIIP